MLIRDLAAASDGPVITISHAHSEVRWQNNKQNLLHIQTAHNEGFCFILAFTSY